MATTYIIYVTAHALFFLYWFVFLEKKIFVFVSGTIVSLGNNWLAMIVIFMGFTNLPSA